MIKPEPRVKSRKGTKTARSTTKKASLKQHNGLVGAVLKVDDVDAGRVPPDGPQDSRLRLARHRRERPAESLPRDQLVARGAEGRAVHRQDFSRAGPRRRSEGLGPAGVATHEHAAVALLLSSERL